MAENTTDAGVHVIGQPHQHPAMRRLARACLALVRWQREQRPDPDEIVHAEDDEAVEPRNADAETPS